MRLVVIAGTALLLTGCGGGSQSNTVNADQGLSADTMTTNDVTAIDAVTGADANMAADVSYVPNVTNALGNAGSTARPGRSEGNMAASTNATATLPATQNSTAPTTNNSL